MRVYYSYHGRCTRRKEKRLAYKVVAGAYRVAGIPMTRTTTAAVLAAAGKWPTGAG